MLMWLCMIVCVLMFVCGCVCGCVCVDVMCVDVDVCVVVRVKYYFSSQINLQYVLVNKKIQVVLTIKQRKIHKHEHLPINVVAKAFYRTFISVSICVYLLEQSTS